MTDSIDIGITLELLIYVHNIRAVDLNKVKDRQKICDETSGDIINVLFTITYKLANSDIRNQYDALYRNYFSANALKRFMPPFQFHTLKIINGGWE